MGRYDDRRIELRERFEDERPLVETRVRKRQPGLVEDDAGDEEEVEIDRARPVARTVTRPAEVSLDLEQNGEERLGMQRRLDLRRTVEKPGLVNQADGIGLAKGRDRDHVDPGSSGEQVERPRERRLPVTEIRPETDVRTTHNPTLKRTRIYRGYQPPTRTPMRLFPALLLALLVAGIAGAPSSAAEPHRAILVELRPSARCTEAVLVASGGGTLVAVSLGLYLVPGDAASRLVPLLRQRGALALSAPNRVAGRLAVTDFTDPLVATEWWRATIGVDALTPPRTGRPVAIIDSGIDVTHPEFLGRVNTETLNEQEPAGIGGEHGTAVASIVAAPANGVGIVGVYPEALLRSWDAAKGQGTQLETFQIVQGVLAAAAGGPGVINLSLGGDTKETVIEQAVYEAIRKGSLVVAASGNSGDTGNALGYPASIPHVLTVGASDASNGIALFSSRSRFVDLAAPGVAIPIATAIGKGWRTGDGTSFAAPLVSGAAAWVWTVRPALDASQLFEIMRRSAVDVGAPGRDDAAGYGILDVPGALSYPAGVRDPLEPNDDLEFVKVDGFYDTSVPPLTTPRRRATTVRARIDRVEDPRDVYRVWLRKNGRVTAVLTADGNLDLSLWSGAAISVTRRNAADGRLAQATTPGTTERLTFTNKGPARYAYLAVLPTKSVREATYRLRVS